MIEPIGTRQTLLALCVVGVLAIAAVRRSRRVPTSSSAIASSS